VEFRSLAEVFLIAPAVFAVAASVGEPGHADPVPGLPILNAVAAGLHPADYFVARDQRELRRVQFPVEHVQIRPADPAGFDAD